MSLQAKTKLPQIIFIFTFLIYLLTSGGNTPYNYFVLFAESFTKGKYWIESAPPWLNELVPNGRGHYYLVYPPMPSILLIPFVLFFGTAFPQQILAHLLGAGTVTLTYQIAQKKLKSTKKALWVSTLTGFGTIIWFLSATGSAWYLGQISACFFITAAIYETASKKRPIAIGLFIGAAYLSRLQTILTLPLILYLTNKKRFSTWPKILIILSIFLSINFGYNFIRFGSILDKAYILIPGVLNEHWYSKGLFHPSYIPRHVKTILLELPKFSKKPPFIWPSWTGLAIWITTPAFIFSLFAPLKKAEVAFSWLVIFLMTAVIFMHGTVGFSQFGYRFAVDFYPVLIFLIIIYLKKTNLNFIHWTLLTISVIVNTWGVLWINKFGWVSF